MLREARSGVFGGHGECENGDQDEAAVTAMATTTSSSVVSMLGLDKRHREHTY